MFKIKTFLVQNVIKEDLKLSDVIDGLEKDEKIIKITSIKNYTEELGVYAVTKKGIIKKTSLKEFDGDYVAQGYYKLKSSDDRVIMVLISPLEIGNIVMVTKKGVAIKFPVDGVSAMGKFTSGVTGITLKDGEEVVYAKYIENDEYKLSVTTKNKKEDIIIVGMLKLQNRAGRGASVVELTMDDEIKSVQLIK